MRHSLDLLAKLRDRHPEKAEGALAVELGYSRGAFQAAVREGHMSAAMAADIAAHVGEDPQKWALVAAAENARNPSAKRRLTSLLHAIP